jgi:hypothetical protein
LYTGRYDILFNTRRDLGARRSKRGDLFNFRRKPFDSRCRWRRFEPVSDGISLPQDAFVM